MVKKGLNKHPGGKAKRQNLDPKAIKKAIQAETGVVIESLDAKTRTVTIAKTADLAKVQSQLGDTFGGWRIQGK